MPELDRQAIRHQIGEILAEHLSAAHKEAKMRDVRLQHTTSFMLMVWALEEMIVYQGTEGSGTPYE